MPRIVFGQLFVGFEKIQWVLYLLYYENKKLSDYPLLKVFLLEIDNAYSGMVSSMKFCIIRENSLTVGFNQLIYRVRDIIWIWLWPHFIEGFVMK